MMFSALAVSVAVMFPGSGQVDPIRADLEAQAARFEQLVLKSRGVVLNDLDKEISKARKAGESAKLSVLQKEREVFSVRNSLPTSVSLNRFDQDISRAEKRMLDGYAKAISRYTKAGNSKTAEIVGRELESFKQTWNLKNTPVDLLAGELPKVWKAKGRTPEHWTFQNGVLRFDGKAKEKFNLVTAKSYENFILRVDWRIGSGGDGGIYLRGRAQVQIWDHTRGSGKGIGSGGLYNNRNYPSVPSEIADNPIGRWNAMAISVVGGKATVVLNGRRVVNDITMENRFKKRKMPSSGPIELQPFAQPIEFRRMTVVELP